MNPLEPIIAKRDLFVNIAEHRIKLLKTQAHKLLCQLDEFEPDMALLTDPIVQTIGEINNIMDGKRDPSASGVLK